MKKLMIAGVVGLCAAVTFALESANVVGYQTSNLAQGYNLYAPTFVNVDGGSMNIQDMKIIGSEGWATEIIYMLNDEGLLTGQSYSWNCPDNGFDTWCWVDDLTGEVADISITNGQGFYLYADAEGLSMQVSGGVKMGALTKDLSFGYNITGNFSPVDVNIQKFKINGSEGWATEIIYVLDDQGLLTSQSYSWNCPDNGFDDWCWVDDLTGEVANFTLAPGQGIYLYSDGDSYTLELPTVLGK